jgi:hypothetical protein
MKMCVSVIPIKNSSVEPNVYEWKVKTLSFIIDSIWHYVYGIWQTMQIEKHVFQLFSNNVDILRISHSNS